MRRNVDSCWDATRNGLRLSSWRCIWMCRRRSVSTSRHSVSNRCCAHQRIWYLPKCHVRLFLIPIRYSYNMAECILTLLPTISVWTAASKSITLLYKWKEKQRKTTEEVDGQCKRRYENIEDKSTTSYGSVVWDRNKWKRQIAASSLLKKWWKKEQVALSIQCFDDGGWGQQGHTTWNISASKTSGIAVINPNCHVGMKCFDLSSEGWG